MKPGMLGTFFKDAGRSASASVESARGPEIPPLGSKRPEVHPAPPLALVQHPQLTPPNERKVRQTWTSSEVTNEEALNVDWQKGPNCAGRARNVSICWKGTAQLLDYSEKAKPFSPCWLPRGCWMTIWLLTSYLTT
ncbi:hypothetical protein ACFS07_32750 [Undibacterium arcticum]